MGRVGEIPSIQGITSVNNLINIINYSYESKINPHLRKERRTER
jgi:hypothetical protein